MTGSIALPRPGVVDAPVALTRDQEEDRLIRRCLAGEAEAFRPLVQRYQRLVFSVAVRMLGSRADAEDASQQAFVDAFRALDRFSADGRTDAFKVWLVRIGINRCKDVLKSKKRTEEPLETDISGAQALFAHDPRNPEIEAVQVQQRRALEAALLKVSPKYREILILKDVEGLAYEEIQTITGLPITTLKIRVVRARAMMRAILKDQSP